MSIEEIVEKERRATEEAFIRGEVKTLDKVFGSNSVFHTHPLMLSNSLVELNSYRVVQSKDETIFKKGEDNETSGNRAQCGRQINRCQ